MIHERNVDEMIVPVHNREYLLGVIAGAAAGVAASAPSSCACVETPVEIFERFKINVTKADDKVQAQAEEKKRRLLFSLYRGLYRSGSNCHNRMQSFISRVLFGEMGKN